MAARLQRNTEKPLSPTEARRQRFVDGMVSGKSMKQAALDAGYSEHTAITACRDIMPHVRDTFRQALHHRISVGKLSDTVAAGLDAEETQFFAHEGKVMDERNVIAWGERRRYAELASRLMGVDPPREASDGVSSKALVVQVLTDGSATRVSIASTIAPGEKVDE